MTTSHLKMYLPKTNDAFPVIVMLVFGGAPFQPCQKSPRLQSLPTKKKKNDDGTGGLFPFPFGIRQIVRGELLNFQGVMSFAKCIIGLLFTIAVAQEIRCDHKIDVLKVVQIWGMVPLSSKDSLDESLLH